MTAPILSIIIISYNTRTMTLACIASVYAQTRTPFEVIVVDNASSDGSAEAIAAAYPEVVVLAETTNHGFAGAHHIAMGHASAPWVLLLNPDTLVLDAALDKLLAFSDTRPAAGIWGGADRLCRWDAEPLFMLGADDCLVAVLPDKWADGCVPKIGSI
jgi:GT2 family glycosyltransferase